MAERPDGTVTFLFTEMAGTEGLLPGAVARYQAILRTAVAAGGGYLFQTHESWGGAAFAAAPAALEAALALERAVQRESAAIPALAGLRLALHTGPARLHDDDYDGPETLGRLARVLAVVPTGQMLLTRATQQQVAVWLPPGAELIDLGEQRFRDLVSSERLFALRGPDQPAACPPLATLNHYPNNLPTQTSFLIGRGPERAALSALLAQPAVRLVTLTGPGGTGKTRLALAVAADLLDAFPDGVYFVPLAGVRHPALVIPTIAGIVGVKEVSHRPLLLSLAEHLGEWAVLLVLDNFEQITGAAAWVARLLAATARVKILVTSRERLRLDNETEFAVPPLAVPDRAHLPPLAAVAAAPAVALFVERARAVQPDFVLTGENAPAVVEICARLDGLPLAIELAAVHSRALAPDTLLARLARRRTTSSLQLLSGGVPHLPARQRTLRSAVDWSHDLLGPGEKRLFARLAIFAGGCTLPAAEEICGGDDLRLDVPVEIAALVARSLLRAERDSAGVLRFWMLSTIYEYARERLALSGEEGPLQHRHGTYYLDLAETAERELAGPQQHLWLERLESEHDNLRAVLEWSAQVADGSGQALGLRLAAALGRFWQVRGHLSEGRDWLERLLAVSSQTPADLRARALAAFGTLATLQGDPAAARAALEEGLALWRALGARQGMADTLNRLGVLVAGQGDYPQAAGLYQECLALWREVGHQGSVAIALNNLGIVARHQGDLPRAAAFYREALALYRTLGDKQRLAVVLLNLGVVCLTQGDYAEARVLYSESLAVRRELGDRRGIALALGNLGEVAQNEGDFSLAADFYEQSLRLRREIGDKSGMALALDGLGELAALRGDYATATDLLEQSLALARQLGEKPGIAAALRGLGQVAAAQGRYAAAGGLLAESLALSRAQGDRLGVARCLEHLAGVAVGQGQAPRAAQLFGAAAALRAHIGAPLPPVARPAYARNLAAGYAQVPTATWEAAWDQGRTQPLDEVLTNLLK